MIKQIILTGIACMIGMHSAIAQETVKTDYPISNVNFNRVKFEDSFWLPRIRQNQEVTIPIALKQCWDTGRIDNFKKAAAILHGKNIGYFGTENPFDDSDVYKILEGLSYSLQNIPDKELEKQLDEIIGYIADAQEPDGYLYTARTAAEPGKLHPWIDQQRWKNAPGLSHELYNMGHLYEAAYAHFIATGKRTLLNVALKNADLLVKDFLVGGLPYEPGHQIIESGLVKLYRLTGKEDYLRLAKYFLDLRGDKGIARSEYSQTHMPVTQQTEAVGHAVRATYMYSGIADVAALTGNRDYVRTINTIWDNVVGKKYYITGGIGALHGGEAFGANYQLPNLTAYNETCAAIANVYWNWRMFLFHGESKYYDVIERTLYNGVLSGISLNGDRFFYPNPLESKGGIQRQEWFGCACCPSNMCRFITSVGGYMFAHKANNVYVNLYAQCEAEIGLGKETVKITEKTDYPWDGKITFTIDKGRKGSKAFGMMFRVPGWVKNQPTPYDLYYYKGATDHSGITLYVNGKQTDYTMENGFMKVSREWKQGDQISFTLPMDIHFTHANDKVADCLGKVSMERGPIVYCMERTDNDTPAFDSFIVEDGAKTSVEWTDDLNGLNRLQVSALNAKDKTPCTMTAIPYYAWANRGDRGMKVWFANNEDVFTNPLGKIAEADTIRLQLTMEPSNDYSPDYKLMIQKHEVANCLGISESELQKELGSKLVYSAVNPDGTLNIESTATTPGHWFNGQGFACGWTVGSKVASEVHIEDQMWLRICQFPNACKSGDHFTIRQALTYRDAGKTSRVVFETKITIK
jgi:uncharacterized protein